MGVQVWGPKPRHGNWGTIMELESVQRTFTRMVGAWKDYHIQRD